MYFDQQTTDQNRLRFVFNGALEQHALAVGTTFGDIARMYNDSSRMRHGNPIAIDVKIGRGGVVRRTPARLD